MARSLSSIIGLIIFIIILVGAGILIYRFIVRDNSNAAVITINNDGKFARTEYKLDNDDVFKVQNNSNKNQTVKKSSDKTTLVEVDANSTSRELTLSDDTNTKLFLASDENQKTTLTVGSPKTTSNSTDNAQTPPPASTPPSGGTSLPNTGPENNLIFIGMIILGGLIYRVSKKFI